MEIGEFIDTYSDDLLTIHEARAATYTHPLRHDYAIADAFLDASFCRILVVFVIGNIEAMFESWRDRDRLNILEKYFAKNGGNNSDRVTSLYRAFSDAGIRVDREVFDDYLAIKYLRNTIIHGQWKEHEKDWLEARGFPTDTRMLKKEHLDKIDHVNKNIMLYVALTGLVDPNAPRPTKLVKLDETIKRDRDDTGILRIRDIERIIWNNLERIEAHMLSHIEGAAVSKEYDWTGGRTQIELETLGHDECKRLFYRAARRAGENNHECLTQHRDLAKEALEFWREYWQRTLAPLETSIRPALEVFTSPDFNPEKKEWSMLANVPDNVAQGIIDQLLPGPGPFTSGQIARALRVGRSAYEHVPNIMPVALFTIRLPIVDPENTQDYLQEAGRALDVLQLGRAWYECVEHHRRLDADSLSFYVHMCAEFGKGARAEVGGE